MLLWFALIGVIILVFFWLLNKMLDAFNEQDYKIRADLENHWYEERDKAIDDSSFHS